jgi:chromosome segregation ATPase
MKTIKLELKMPTFDEITRDVKPLTVKAEQIAAEAERKLPELRTELAACEKRVRELPDQVRAGRASPSELEKALRDRDAMKARIAQAAVDAVTARERASNATRDADVERRRLIGDRIKLLEDVRDQINPVLVELRELCGAVARADGRNGVIGLAWCDSPASMLRFR